MHKDVSIDLVYRVQVNEKDRWVTVGYEDTYEEAENAAIEYLEETEFDAEDLAKK